MSTSRRANFKNEGKTNKEMRNRRQNHNIELRKNKRVDQMMKRRNVIEQKEATTPLGNSQTENRKSGASIAQLPELSQMIFSDDMAQAYQGTQKCRQLLSKEKNPPINDVIKAGLVARFIEFLGADAFPKLQFEAAWALTNIASGTADQTACVVEAGALPYLTKLLSSPEEDVREQAIWAIGNIAGDGPVYRDMVISTGIMPPLLELLSSGAAKLSMQRNCTWVLSNLCRGKNPQPDFEVVKHAIPTLGLLLQSQDEEVVTDSTWAVSYLSDGDNYKIQSIVEGGLTRRLVELMYHQSTSVKTPALRAVGNIVTGTDEQTQAVLDCSALPAFASLLQSNNQTILKETCWTLSNITAGSVEQIQSIIDNNLIPCLIEVLKKGEFKAKKEAAWAMSNLSTGAVQQQIHYIIEQGVIPPLCNLLTVQDSKIVGVVLDCLANILKAGVMPDGTNPCIDFIEEAGGIDHIESLQEHENQDVYEKALKLIETYFQDEEEEDMALAPEANGSQFAFGGQQQLVAPVGGFAF